MKITGFELFKVRPRWLFLKVDTDAGISGWGEPVIEGKADTVRTAVEELMGRIMGGDPRHIEEHWNTLYRDGFYRGGPILMSAMAGIDQALWDIKGKALDVPIYELLGGKTRDTIKVYSPLEREPLEDLVQAARDARDAGFTAAKMNGCAEQMQIIDSHQKIDRAIHRVAAVREAVGDALDIGIDFHGRLHKPMAKVLAKELEPFHPMFIEEPVLPEHNDALREIARHSSIPIATGERMYSRWDFKSLLADGVVDIIQPDVSHAGGITECKKIFSMAEAYDVAAAPHCPIGPIALAACLQVDACCYNAFIQEQSITSIYNDDIDLLDYLTNREVFDIKGGQLQIPTGPGLGIEMNEDYVREMATQSHEWKNPTWRHQDGSIAEW
ncbi:MAG: galactonate dehydratase [Verrucomicrobiota bacterium]